MDQRALTFIVIVIAVFAIAAAVLIISRRHRSQRLKQRFGPEYDLAIRRRGNSAKAEIELLNREKRVHNYSIKPLSPAARERFTEEWSAVQRRFVDDPALAVTEADSLVNRVMIERGYPMADWEQRAADVSVTYPDVVQNYRSACAIVRRHGQGEAGTEDLRQAMMHYRSLFDDLLDLPNSAATSRGFIHERAS